MAILSQIPEIDVTIHVDDQPAQEYAFPDQHDDRAPSGSGAPSHECYIESKSGQTYSVKVLVAPGLQVPSPLVVGCSLSVDGTQIDRRCSTRRRASQPIQVDFVGPIRSSPTTGELMRHKLSFSPVATVEETSETELKRDSRVSATLGTIVVDVFTCQTLDQIVRFPSQQQEPQQGAFTLAEKSMKGKELSHGTRYTDGQSYIGKRQTRRVRDVKLIARYTFHYRSRVAMQKEMIIPQTPPPPELSVADEVQTMTETEVRRLAEKLLRMQKEKEIKREKGEVPGTKRIIDLTDVDFVANSRPARSKVAKLEDGIDVVDLT